MQACNNEDLYSLDFPDLSIRRETDTKACDFAIQNMTAASVTVNQDPTDENADVSTFSTLEWRDGAFVPVQRSPSPPLVLSAERREFDERIRCARAQREANMREYTDEGTLFRIMLHWRHEQQLEAVNFALPLWLPLPRPWTINTLKQCSNYPALLNQYYEIESETASKLGEQHDKIQEAINGENWDPDLFAQLDRLHKWEAEKKKDLEETDARILTPMLDAMEERLMDAIVQKCDSEGIENDEVHEIVTEFSKGLRTAVRAIPRLRDRYDGLRELERQAWPHCFPREDDTEMPDLVDSSGRMNPLFDPKFKKRKR